LAYGQSIGWEDTKHYGTGLLGIFQFTVEKSLGMRFLKGVVVG
jgi:hypothetical protein